MNYTIIVHNFRYIIINMFLANTVTNENKLFFFKKLMCFIISRLLMLSKTKDRMKSTIENVHTQTRLI